MLKIERRRPLRAKIGVVGVGHHTYWDKFPGLLEVMRAKQVRLVQRIQAHRVDVLDFGLVDQSQSAYAAL